MKVWLEELPKEPQPGDIWTEPVTGMEFVWVPGGCFQMGQTESGKRQVIEEEGRKIYEKVCRDELPRHEACLDGFCRRGTCCLPGPVPEVGEHQISVVR